MAPLLLVGHTRVVVLSNDFVDSWLRVVVTQAVVVYHAAMRGVVERH